jgi:integrase
MRLRLVSPMTPKGSANSYFTKRIPADIKAQLVGQTLLIPVGDSTVSFIVTPSTQSVRFSLRSSDPSTIRMRLAQALAYVEEFFARVRLGQPVDLTPRQIASLVGEVHAAWAQGPDAAHMLTVNAQTGAVETDHFTDPELVMEWDQMERELAERAATDAASFFGQPTGGQKLEQLAERMGRLKGIPSLSERSVAQLTARIPQAVAEGMKTGAKKLAGDYSPDAKLSGYPQWESSPLASMPPMPAAKVSLMGLVASWWAEAKSVGKSESTRESYTNTFKGFSAFLEHDEATRVTPEDIVAYKDHRLTTPNRKTGKPVSAKTVKASDLTAFKSVFDWAVANRKLASNPATGVNLKLGKRVKVRDRDFTDTEAKALLTAANKVLAGMAKPNQTDLAKRWVPWLCAYSGARVGELVQLRTEDFSQDASTGAWVMRLTPEAGTVKGKEFREVPLHAHLIEMGFMEFVEKAQSGYLFMTIKPGKSFAGVWQSKKNRLAEFAREYVKDPNVAPNHGWRHTFKSLGFEAAVQEKVLDAICGHAPASTGRAYGSVSLKTKVDAMALFPRFEVGE